MIIPAADPCSTGMAPVDLMGLSDHLRFMMVADVSMILPSAGTDPTLPLGAMPASGAFGRQANHRTCHAGHRFCDDTTLGATD